MTTEQYQLLTQFANDLDSALREYPDKHKCFSFEDENISDAIQAAVKMMHLIRTLHVPVLGKLDGIDDPF